MSIYYVAGFPCSSELYHHGIKEQRWGVRRYQYEDGSLTPAGRKHYDVGPPLSQTKNQRKTTREELGFKKRGHLNTVQKHVLKKYKKNKRISDRLYSDARKSESKGKTHVGLVSTKRMISLAKKYENKANQYSSMARKYNELTSKEKRKINRGVWFSKHIGNAVGSVGVNILFGHVVSEGVVDARIKKKLGD